MENAEQTQGAALPYIFDSHAHYDDPSFDGDRAQLLEELPGKGVVHVLNVGADLAGSAAAVELAARYDYIHAAVGVHPESAGALPGGWLDQLEALARSHKVQAIGEIGLDYHYDDGAPRDLQQQVFESQLQLANQLNLPVVIHSREAHGDTMALLRKYRPQGVMHCYSGSVEMMRDLMDMGMYIGLGGVVTFKNARVPVEVAAAVPLDRLLLETDAPYMAPVPFRGKRCDSAMICYTAQRIAQIREMDVAALYRATAHNAARLFHIALA